MSLSKFHHLHYYFTAITSNYNFFEHNLPIHQDRKKIVYDKVVIVYMQITFSCF